MGSLALPCIDLACFLLQVAVVLRHADDSAPTAAEVGLQFAFIHSQRVGHTRTTLMREPFGSEQLGTHQLGFLVLCETTHTSQSR